MALLSLAIAVLAALTAANAQYSVQTLTSCDDCYTTPAAFTYYQPYFNGQRYGAYSVSRNYN